jgi:uncharacterized protein with gpF-like domain
MPRELSTMAERFTSATIYLKKVRDKNRIARSHLPAVKAFFARQEKMVLLRLQMLQSFYQPISGPRAMEAKRPANTDTLKRWDELWQGIEYDTNTDLQKIIAAIERDGLQRGAEQLATQLGFDAKSTFALSNPRAVAYFKQNGGSLSYIRDIQKTTKDSLKRVITTGLDEGWSYNQTAREIQKLYDGPISRQRATLIATNEAAHAYEAGNMAFSQSLKDDGIIMEKRWENSGDDRVSDGCLGNTADGWIPIDEPHSSGDQYPPRFPGCRCYEVYREAPA